MAFFRGKKLIQLIKGGSGGGIEGVSVVDEALNVEMTNESTFYDVNVDIQNEAAPRIKVKPNDYAEPVIVIEGNGYYSFNANNNDGELYNVPNHSEENIKMGVSIGGKTGTCPSLKAILDRKKSCYYFFYSYDETSIDDLMSYNDTENVTSMHGMFSYCQELTNIPLLNTSKVTTMYEMFYICSKLTEVPLLDTSKVTTMSGMFCLCTSLKTIPAFNTSNVTGMNNMFQGCNSLESIPALDVSNVNSMDRIFMSCPNLKSILMTGMKVSFDISASTKFERSNLVTILNNLATVGTTQTLTMGETNFAKLTLDDIKIATNKGWQLA